MKRKPARFSDLFRVKHGYAFKSQYFDSAGAYVLLTPGNFREEGGYRDQGEKQKFYTGDIPNGFILNHEDLVVAMTEQAPGLLGSSVWIPEGNRFLHNQRLGLICELDERMIEKRYLYYLFNTSEVRHQISASASGTKVRHTSPDRIGEVTVNLPSRASQRRIAETLTAYDDLIENNRRRMALLEEAARQLYHEWFVRLRFPGHEHTPIVDGIPQGWRKIELKRLIDVRHGFAFQGDHFSESETSRVLTTPGNFAVGGGFKMNKVKYYGEESPLDSNHVLAPMDLILTMTDLSKDSDTLGYPAFVPRLNGLSFLHNQRIGKVVPIVDFFPRRFLYFVFCRSDYRQHVVGAATGTAVKHTSPSRILAYPVLMPNGDGLVSEFERTTEPLFDQLHCLGEANYKLRAARDLLLPKLMSGEIAV